MTAPGTAPGTTPSVAHATFAIERVYDASPARVFRAFADPEAKARWFACMDASAASHFELDFRVGGREVNRLVPPDGPAHVMEGRFWDIVPDRRIVYSYAMYLGDTRLSVSLVTLEFEAAGTGTRLVFTEQGAFLDGHQEPAERERGTTIGLDRLADALRAELAPA